MHPYLFSLGPIQIHAYGFMMAAAFAAGLVNWIWLGRKHGYSRDLCTDLMIWVMLSGILGARVAYVLEHWGMFLENPSQIFRLDQGGLIFYGGFGGSAIAVYIFGRRHRLSAIPLVDFTLTAVPLSHALGRVGCFLNGCCFGSVCGDGCGVVFPRFSLPWHHQLEHARIAADAAGSLPVHPVQLYEAGFNLIVYVVLLVVYRRQRRAGLTTASYFTLYAVGRFVLEFFRGDHADRASLMGLSAGQVVSIPLVLVGIVLLAILLFKRGHADAAVGRS